MKALARNNYDDLHHGLSEAAIVELHLECLDGNCGHCEGRGRVDCACLECGHQHQSDCDHCEGSGACHWRDGEMVERVEHAKQEWDQLKSDTVHPLTQAGFTAAYTQMFGRPPLDAELQEFQRTIATLRASAGIPEARA